MFAGVFGWKDTSGSRGVLNKFRRLTDTVENGFSAVRRKV